MDELPKAISVEDGTYPYKLIKFWGKCDEFGNGQHLIRTIRVEESEADKLFKEICLKWDKERKRREQWQSK